MAGATRVFGPRLDDLEAWLPVRPPGSVPEREFLQLCIRCGECFQACPNDALQPLAFQQGLAGLWTPHVVADWSGCEPSCANCGQVCPTGAIRALPLEEKRHAHIGLAVVNKETCLPYAGTGDCQLCLDECETAGYHAIEFVRVGTKLDEHGQPIEDTGFLAPVVLAEKCVGCGLCQTRCLAINATRRACSTSRPSASRPATAAKTASPAARTSICVKPNANASKPSAAHSSSKAAAARAISTGNVTAGAVPTLAVCMKRHPPPATCPRPAWARHRPDLRSQPTAHCLGVLFENGAGCGVCEICELCKYQSKHNPNTMLAAH